jgi:hypothetical protein
MRIAGASGVAASTLLEDSTWREQINTQPL